MCVAAGKIVRTFSDIDLTMLSEHDKPQHINALIPMNINDHSSCICFSIEYAERYQLEILLSYHRCI